MRKAKDLEILAKEAEISTQPQPIEVIRAANTTLFTTLNVHCRRYFRLSPSTCDPGKCYHDDDDYGNAKDLKLTTASPIATEAQHCQQLLQAEKEAAHQKTRYDAAIGFVKVANIIADQDLLDKMSTAKMTKIAFTKAETEYKAALERLTVDETDDGEQEFPHPPEPKLQPIMVRNCGNLKTVVADIVTWHRQLVPGRKFTHKNDFAMSGRGDNEMLKRTVTPPVGRNMIPQISLSQTTNSLAETTDVHLLGTPPVTPLLTELSSPTTMKR
ncbi:hypothetical protein CEXT_362441 [Caerostris extrusa]|uniref:Uncharacterized protein n=1 Tax=Caerostris extrusa TaxID=172846 RepID=A0AAV4VGV8_CAEEX|nr:hypothetical protein CEXT_362441 [Caerostris extrusa]